MSLPKIQFLGCAFALCVSACGTVSVKYGEPLQSPTSVPAGSADATVAAIVAAAANGNQTAVLPVSRLIVVGTSAQAQDGGQRIGAVQGDAPPPPPPSEQPAAAPGHPVAGGKGSKGGKDDKAAAATTPKPAQLPTQPASQAASQAGGNQNAKPAASTAPAPSVTTTFTSADGSIKYAVNVVQVESVVTFMVQPTNNFFSKNDFSITRLANTRIPTTISNTFTDETAARVKTFASIAAAVIPLAAAAAPSHEATVTPAVSQCLSEDFVVDDDALKPQAATAGANLKGWTTRKVAWANSGSDQCLQISLDADPLAPNLVPVSSLAAAFAGKGGDWSKVWPVPACMTVHVVIKPQGAADSDRRAATGQLTVIDPDYVELMPIPKKGKIAMHPICGADLADSAADPYQTDFDAVSAMVAAFPAQSTNKSTNTSTHK
jgi:hypothetical protein